MKDRTEYYKKLIKQRERSIIFLNRVKNDWSESTITLKYQGEEYYVPHYMRYEIISSIIKEEELSIKRLEAQIMHLSKK